MPTLSRERRIQVLSWVLFAILATWFLAGSWPLLSLAFAQDAPPVAVTPVPAADPMMAALLALLQGGGLPAVLVLMLVQARSVFAAGIPVTVQLSTDDRARADRLIRVLDRRGRALTGALADVNSEDRDRRGLANDDSADHSDEPPVRR